MHQSQNTAQHRQVSALPAELMENSLHIKGDLEVSYGGAPMKLCLADAAANGSRGTYCQNNGKIAFITGEGEFRVVPYASGFAEAFAAAGYKDGSLFVPLSNGEVPVDAKMRTEWDRIRERVDEIREVEHVERVRERYREAAMIAGIKPGAAAQGDFWNTDHVPYRYTTQGAVRTNPGPVESVESRVGQVGAYCSNNGLIAFVDESGSCYIGALTSENRDILKSHGYREDFVYVPFSNGECPVSQADFERYKSIRGL